MRSKIKTTMKVAPSSILEMLDKCQVEFMVYDFQQDSQWIEYFRKRAEWKIGAEDREIILFIRNK